MPATRIRTLILILGDQLDPKSAVLKGIDPERDLVWMAEVREESERVWSHRARIVLFLSAMRHFRAELEERGIAVRYRALGGPGPESLGELLKYDIQRLNPERVVIVEPGEYGVREALVAACKQSDLELELLPDTHFFDTIQGFRDYAAGRKGRLTLEYYYRHLRRRTGYLMRGDEPEGGKWNYDADNRESFKKGQAPVRPPTRAFRPDAVTREVIELVEREFADHPGSLADFDWPVTRRAARDALRDFVRYRLADFGRYQDAMLADGSPYLYHSRLSAAMNLKLLNPREVCAAVVAAYADGQVPLNAAEGFLRQVLGWREFVRGLYWLHMPGFTERNALEADRPLPEFYWNGDTEMNCLRRTLDQTLKHGYAHHIQRLMVTGLFAMLLGVRPVEVHRWYLAIYVDAVEWVELPNTIGMSQYADGGLMATKPYAASGKYIQRMSDYCSGCRYRPDHTAGERACPYSVLYWDFLARNRERLAGNARMKMQYRNLERMPAEKLARIRADAGRLRDGLS